MAAARKWVRSSASARASASLAVARPAGSPRRFITPARARVAGQAVEREAAVTAAHFAPALEHGGEQLEIHVFPGRHQGHRLAAGQVHRLVERERGESFVGLHGLMMVMASVSSDLMGRAGYEVSPTQTSGGPACPGGSGTSTWPLVVKPPDVFRRAGGPGVEGEALDGHALVGTAFSWCSLTRARLRP